MCSNSTGCLNVYPIVLIDRLSEEEISKWTSRSLHKTTKVDECSSLIITKTRKTKKDLTCNTTVRRELTPRMCRQNKAGIGNTGCFLKSNPILRNATRYQRPTQISNINSCNTAEKKFLTLKRLPTNSITKNVVLKLNHHLRNNSLDPINICAGEEKIKVELENDDIINCVNSESSSDSFSRNNSEIRNITPYGCGGILELNEYDSNKLLNDIIPVKSENEVTVSPGSGVQYDPEELKLPCEDNLSNEDKKDIKLFKSNELNSEIAVIKEIENCWFKIANADPVNKKNQSFSRATQIASLIDENKAVTIPIHSVIKFINSREEESSDNIKIIKEVKFSEEIKKDMKGGREEEISFGKSDTLKKNKLVQNDDTNIYSSDSYDVSTHLMSLDTRNNSESRIEEICLLYPHYFNANVQLLITAMVKTLDIMFREFFRENKNKNNQPGSFGLEDLLSDAFSSVLRKYSKQFVSLFQIIVNSFNEIHKPKMIPIIHLLLTKGMENIGFSSVKPQYVRNTILRIFEVENIVNKYDILKEKNHEEAKKVLSIYERWLAKYLVDENNSESNKVHKFSCCTGDCVTGDNVPVEDFNKTLHECISSEDVITENNQSTCRIKQCQLEKRRVPIFETEELCFEECVNSTCTKKTCVLCYYCKEPVCCEELCEVEDCQILGLLRVTAEEYDLFLLTCKHHKGISWDENYFEDWAVVGDHKMPYEPQCWKAGCGERAGILCVCKTRAYCTMECQDADWFEVHHKQCTRRPEPDLLLALKST